MKLPILLLTAAAMFAGAIAAQNTSGPATPPHLRAPSNVDSGYLDNRSGTERVVFRHRLRFDQTSWLQVRFAETTNLPAGSFLRLTAALDGGLQRHDGATIVEWSWWSAAFNGNDVLLELVAAPGSTGNRVAVDETIRGFVTAPIQESICGPADNRVQSFDKRQGRMWIGCSGWLIGNYAVGDLMLSAGHCVTGGPFILELNVPNSTAGGSIVRSSPNDQYPFTVNGSLNAGVGSDWSVSVVGKNSNTGKLPTETNGGVFYNLGPVPPSPGGNNIRITGYGVSNIATLTQVQKTHVGPLAQVGSTSLCYTTDTTGGNSGSPVIHENTGNAIGIHTHGGCSSSGGCNSGTRADRADLQAAITKLSKTAGKFTRFGTGCPGTYFGATPQLSNAGVPEIGKSFDIGLALAKPGASAFLLTGFSNTAFAGGSLPFALGPFGGGSCSLLVDPLIASGITTSALGIGSVKLPIPNDPTLVGKNAYHQWLVLDTGANSLGVAVTGGGQSAIGG